jgi:gluconolactonase
VRRWTMAACMDQTVARHAAQSTAWCGALSSPASVTSEIADVKRELAQSFNATSLVSWSMPQLRYCVLVLIAWSCGRPGIPLPSDSELRPVKVADFPGYSEGIAFDSSGTAYVSVGRNPDSSHAIYRIPRGGAPEVWIHLRIPNGHKVLRDGTHVIAAQGSVLHVSSAGHVLDSLTQDVTGLGFRRPNDIALDGHDGFYFTDPGAGESGRSSGTLFYVDGKFRVTLAAKGFCYPNGIVVRPDGRALYVDDGCNGRVYQLPISSPGQLGPRSVLAAIQDGSDAGPDGMTLDAAGRLYIAHYGMAQVVVLDQHGRQLRRYAAGNLLASNVAFGGPDYGDLYVTASPDRTSDRGALYRLHLGIQGRGSAATPSP